MSVKLREMLDKRNRLITEARALVTKAETERRSLTDDEKKQYDTIMKDATETRENIDRENLLIEEEKRNIGVALGNLGTTELPAPDAELRTKAFRSLILNGAGALSADESRALTAGSDATGGFLVAPMEFVSTLIAAVKNQVFIEVMATTYNLTTSTSMGAPSLDSDVDDPDWTPEVKDAPEDKGLGFGRRELTPHPLAKLVKISNKLLRAAALNPEAIVMDRLAYKFAVAKEKGYMLGSGAQQPLGVFVASADGINTDRDITASAGTEFLADDLINMKYGMKAQYLAKASWIFHRDGVKMAAKLKDGDGQYLLDLADRPDAPDVILGRPVKMSEYAPNTFTSGKYVGILGDFSYYWICNALNLQFQRLNELYAAKNQVGFIGRMESDGMPVLSEAFARLKLA